MSTPLEVVVSGTSHYEKSGYTIAVAKPFEESLPFQFE
jgi:hypothetical protein